jgi:hypothetical protein
MGGQMDNVRITKWLWHRRQSVNAFLGAMASFGSAVALVTNSPSRVSGSIFFALGVCVAWALHYRMENVWHQERDDLKRELVHGGNYVEHR